MHTGDVWGTKMPQSLFDYIREYQDSHDCSDDDMIEILCDCIEVVQNADPKWENLTGLIKECLSGS